MDTQNLSEQLRDSFSLLMDNLVEISSRLNLEPVMYPRNVTATQYGAQWGTYKIRVYVRNNKVHYSFNHPSDKEYAQNDRSGDHKFTEYKQCLQSMVQHRTFEVVKEIYEQT